MGDQTSGARAQLERVAARSGKRDLHIPGLANADRLLRAPAAALPGGKLVAVSRDRVPEGGGAVPHQPELEVRSSHRDIHQAEPVTQPGGKRDFGKRVPTAVQDRLEVRAFSRHEDVVTVGVPGLTGLEYDERSPESPAHLADLVEMRVVHEAARAGRSDPHFE